MTRFRPLLGEREIAMEVAPDLPLVRVDAVLLDAIVSNILDNIADHTPAGDAAGCPRAHCCARAGSA